MDDNCLSCKSTYLGGNLKKRLIVCCDGTASAVDKGTKEFVSNVGRLSRSIARVGVTPEGEKVPQIVYYQAGVGSGQSLPIQKAKEGGLSRHRNSIFSLSDDSQELSALVWPRTSARHITSWQPTGHLVMKYSFSGSRAALTQLELSPVSSARSDCSLL